MFGHPVTISVAHKVGQRMGDVVYGDLAALGGWAVAPGNGAEFSTPVGDQVQADITLYGPYGADVTPYDRVWLPGDDLADPGPWEVVGERQDWQNPYTGRKAGCVVRIRKVV